MKELDPLRERIDRADRALLEALAQRMKTVEDILRTKDAQGLPLFDRDREAALLTKVAAEAVRLDLDPRLAQRVLTEVVAFSRELQARRVQDQRNPGLKQAVRIAYQGAQGAYSWLAIRKHFGDGVEPIGYQGFADAVRALESGDVDLAFLPIENVLAGSIYEVYDLLVQSHLHVVGEEVIRIEHCLIGHPGITPEQVRAVFSHPVALMQCMSFIRSLPHAVCQSYTDSADAVRKVAQDGDPHEAAIASRQAAELYGLHVLKEGISDHPENFTRFWVISREPVTVDLRVPAKTSLQLVTEHREGALVACLSALAAQGISLSKLESRPIKGTPWQYQFYLDLEGNTEEERMIRALDDVRSRARVLRVLGCYPRAGARDPELPGPWPTSSSATLPELGQAVREPLVSRERRRQQTVVDVGKVRIGEDRFCVIAGPAGFSTEARFLDVAAQLQENGADILWVGPPPALSQYGVDETGGKDSIRLSRAGRSIGIPLACEVYSPDQVVAVAPEVELLRVGPANMQNLALLRKVARSGKPILLTRGMSSTLEELLKAAEFLLESGNQQVVLCDRGIRTFDTAERATLDPGAILYLKEHTHLPVVVDPGAAAEKPDWVPSLVESARIAGADGVLLEVEAGPDGSGGISLSMFQELMKRWREG